MAQWDKLQIGAHTSHINVLFSIQLPGNVPGRQLMMARELRFLPFMWVPGMEFWAPGFGFIYP